MTSEGMVERKELPLTELDGYTGNPNKMSARAFDLLVDNMQQHGCTENVVVRPKNGRYEIVSGHHRVKAAQYLGWEFVPCAIIADPDFDDEAAAFQVVRMNAIRGKLDPQLFMEQYSKVAGKYGDEILQDMFGFADEAEFKKLITATAKGLPEEMKGKFLEAAKEIKTIDGLAQILNSLFTKYGSTVPYEYMCMEHGGQRHVWVRISKKTYDALMVIGDMCIEESVSMDAILGEVIRKIAAGELNEMITEIVEAAPKVVVPTGFNMMPTMDNLEAVQALQ